MNGVWLIWELAGAKCLHKGGVKGGGYVYGFAAFCGNGYTHGYHKGAGSGSGRYGFPDGSFIYWEVLS